MTALVQTLQAISGAAGFLALVLGAAHQLTLAADSDASSLTGLLLSQQGSHHA
jgi:hypothetical protein